MTDTPTEPADEGEPTREHPLELDVEDVADADDIAEDWPQPAPDPPVEPSHDPAGDGVPDAS